MLREDIDENHFVLSSCCYTTFVIPNGVFEYKRIKKLFDEGISSFLDKILQSNE